MHDLTSGALDIIIIIVEKPNKWPDFSKLVVTTSLTLEARAGYMTFKLNKTSLNIADNGFEHPLLTEVSNDVSASFLGLVSPDKDKHLFSTEDKNTCDSGMEAQSKEVGVELNKYPHIP